MSRRGGFAAFQANAKKEDVAKQEGPKVIGADVLKKSRRPDPNLSLDATKALLERLRSNVVSPEFQAALSNLRSRDFGAFKKRKAVAKLLAMAWKDSMKASGFGIDEAGFPQMLATVRRHADKPGIKTLSEEVEKTMKFFPGALFGSKAGELKQSELAQSARAAGAFSAAVEGTSTAPTAPEPDGQSMRDRAVNLGEAKEMLKAFKEVASSAEFQRTIENMRKRGESTYSNLLPNFVGEMWKSTLELFDFPATPAGFQEVFRGISKHGWNLHVKTQAHEIERLLFVPIGSTFYITGEGSESSVSGETNASAEPSSEPPAPEKKLLRPGDIEIEVSHAVHQTSIKVSVASTATFRDLKQAIVDLLGRDEMFTRGKLVKKNGGIYSAYKDNDKIGTIRNVMVLGADLSLPEVAQTTGEHAPYQSTAPNRKVEDGQLFPTQLTLQQALNLQTELHLGFSQPAFQEKMQSLQKQLPGSAKALKECSEHILSVQQTILPKYGFQGNQKGVYDMLKAFEPHNANAEVKKKGEEINKLIEGKKLTEHTQRSSTKSSESGYLQGGSSHNNFLAAAGADSVDDRKSDALQSELKTATPTPECQAPKPEPSPPRDIAEEPKPEPQPQRKSEEAPTPELPPRESDEAPKTEPPSQKQETAKPEPLPPKTEEAQKPEPPLPQEIEEAPKPESLPPREIEVVVRHATKDHDMVQFKVMTDWTFKKVKETLATVIVHDDVRRKARLVFKSGSDWKTYQDAAVVGDQTELLCLGVETLKLVAREVDISIQHAIETARGTFLKVWTNWTFKEVREALARRVGSDEIREKARFVFKADSDNSSWTSFKDEELVGERKKLHLLGCDELFDKPEKPAMVEVSIKGEKPLEVEVSIKHVHSDAQLQVTVPSIATMQDVKQAISQHIGRADIATEGRIVQPQGHVPYHDSDLLGKRRRLLFVGPDFSLEAKLENTPNAVEDRLPVECKDTCESTTAKFTLQCAHTLLKRMREECNQFDLQEKTADPLAVGEHLMESCAGPAADLGFGTDENAMRLMLSTIKSFETDSLVQKHLREIEDSLHLPSGTVLFIADNIVAAAAV